MRGRIGLGVICAVSGGWLVLAPGCGDNPCVDSPVVTDGDSCGGPPTPAVDCTPLVDGQTHWIAIDNSKQCISIPGFSGGKWQGSHLFFNSLFPGENLPSYSGTLGRYCRYIWSGAGAPTQNDIENLKDFIGDVNLVQDLPAVVPQGAFESWASSNFLDGVNWGNITQPVSRVRIEVIDNKASGNNGSSIGGAIGVSTNSGNNFHGHLLTSLIEKGIALGGGGGDVVVSNKVAMPWRRVEPFEFNVSTLGDYGRYGDLIEAIDLATYTWGQEILQSNDPAVGNVPLRLVLNLSLGFEHEADSCNVMDDSCVSAEKVVYDAIREAACHGAGIVAAAGNDTGGLNPTTALILPGGWQEHQTPDDDRCARLLGGEYFKALNKKYPGTLRPPIQSKGSNDPEKKYPYLLHAVGAVDHQGQALVTARPGACPRFVALGLGWIPDNAPTGATVLSGSSTATAVVSTKAAVAWSLDTSRNFDDVLWDMVEPWQLFHPKGACGGGATCGELKWIGGQASALSSQNPTGNFTTPTGVNTNPQAKDCKNDPDTVIPHCVRSTTLPFAEVFPQPTEIPCGKNCVVALAPSTSPNQPSTLYVEPANKWLEAMLVVEHNGVTRTFGLGTLPASSNGNVFEILLPDPIPENARVWISAYDDSGNRTRSQQILIAKKP